MSDNRTTTETIVSTRLDAELRRLLWALYDAAKVISYHSDDATPDQWSAFFRAVANVPESQHGR